MDSYLVARDSIVNEFSETLIALLAAHTRGDITFEEWYTSRATVYRLAGRLGIADKVRAAAPRCAAFDAVAADWTTAT